MRKLRALDIEMHVTTECNNQNRLSVRKVGSAYDVRLYAGKVIALRSRLASTTGLMQKIIKSHKKVSKIIDFFVLLLVGYDQGSYVSCGIPFIQLSW